MHAPLRGVGRSPSRSQPSPSSHWGGMTRGAQLGVLGPFSWQAHWMQRSEPQSQLSGVPGWRPVLHARLERRCTRGRSSQSTRFRAAVGRRPRRPGSGGSGQRSAEKLHRRGRSTRAACALRTDASHRVHADRANHQQSGDRRRAHARRVSRRLATGADIRCRGRNRRRMDHESGAIQSHRPIAFRAAEETREPRSGRPLPRRPPGPQDDFDVRRAGPRPAQTP